MDFDLTFADFMAGLFSDPEMGQPAGAHVPTPSPPAVSVAEWQQDLALPTPLELPSTSVAFQGTMDFDLTFADFMAGLFSDPEMGQPAGGHVPTPSTPAVSAAEWQQDLVLPTPLELPSTSVAFQGCPTPRGTFNTLMHLNTDMMDLFHPMSPYPAYEPAMSTLSATFPSTNQFYSDAFNLQGTEEAFALSGVPLM
ncbi:hypothetical protein C0991_010164, partial [Blastosporella zonata]